jgi:hypothetical protein
MGDNTENENVLAETEGPGGGNGNDMIVCVGREMRRVGAAQTGGMARAGGGGRG